MAAFQSGRLLFLFIYIAYNMIAYENGRKHSNFYMWEIRKHAPYDYKRHGLVQHLMSKTIIESKNPITIYFVSVLNNVLTFMSKSVDILKNWKNFLVKNR